MSWWKQFKPKACGVRVKGSTRDEVLDEIVANMVKAQILAEDLAGPALKALREREQVASTGVGMSVAIPHVKLDGVETAACSLSVIDGEVDWSAVDGAPVSIVFMVLRPETAGELHDPEKHLEMMRGIARLARDSDFRSFVLRAKTKTELVGLLRELSTV